MKQFDVTIVGGGVTGTSLYYLLSQFSNIESVCLVEKHDKVAPLNSSSWANSQTLHIGDIETNYNLEKALKVRAQATQLRRYALKQSNAKEIIFPYPKMILAVGEAEVAELKDRYEVFKSHFTHMEWWDAQTIAKYEPSVALVDGKVRKDPIAAMGCESDYCAVNYANLSRSMLKNAEANATKTETLLDTKLIASKEHDDHFMLDLMQGENPLQIKTKFLVIASGAHSLLFAHRMGYGKHLSTLSVGGSFYYSNLPLNGKVYTMQNPHLPFAAVHGDPDVAEGKTRFGPTALFLLKLERYQSGSVKEFFELLKLDRGLFNAFWKLVRVSDIRNYILKNFLFEVPWIRERLFAKDIQKIVPSIKPKDIYFAKGVGGNRPQVIDRDKGLLIMGEAALEGEKVIFNITPSPGASTCIATARDSLYTIAKKLSLTVNETHLSQVLDHD